MAKNLATAGFWREMETHWMSIRWSITKAKQVRRHGQQNSRMGGNFLQQRLLSTNALQLLCLVLARLTFRSLRKGVRDAPAHAEGAVKVCGNSGVLSGCNLAMALP